MSLNALIVYLLEKDIKVGNIECMILSLAGLDYRFGSALAAAEKTALLL